MRYVGIKDSKICVVSDDLIENSQLTVLEVPEELSHLSSIEIATYCKFKNNTLVSKKAKKNASDLKVAFVTNWKMKCGISTYAENLWPEIAPHLKEYKLFIEYNDNPTDILHQVGDQQIDLDRVVPCWKRGENLSNLIKEIKEYDPDLVLIQHEFGLWPNAMHWLSMMTQLSEYRVIVIMHSVFHHRDKTIVEASIPEIVVHLDGAKDVLKNEKGIPADVHVIPHGCYPLINKERLWNFYKSNHTFMQAGFGFRYKNFEYPIKAVALLKQKYSDVFLTILFSEAPNNLVEHQKYYDELISLIESLDIKENVAIIRGYQSDETLDSYLRTNKVAVFSYTSAPGHEVFGASGAARLAMAANIPIITSSVPHFSDLPSIKTDTPEDIAKELDVLFGSKQAIKEQLLKQENYVNDNSWAQVALQYIKAFEN